MTNPLENVDSRLIDSICEEIAHFYPFTSQNILSAYRICKSFDIVLLACELAGEMGTSLDNAFVTLVKSGAHLTPSDAR